MSGKLSSSKRVDAGAKFTGTCRFLSPVRYLKYVGDQMAVALRFIAPRKRGSTKVSSSGTPKRLSVVTFDSQRAEAIDDCIEFINSSSSLTRSNSVAC